MRVNGQIRGLFCSLKQYIGAREFSKIFRKDFASYFLLDYFSFLTGEHTITIIEITYIVSTIPMSTGLTSRQATILEFIETYQLQNGYSPKIAEIQDAFEIKSVNGVIKHLRALEKKGFIKRDNTARGIALFDKVKQKLETTLLQVPLFGSIPAGNPQDLTDYVEGYIPFDASFLGKHGDIYALTVRGESMIDAGIFEGDIVIAERTQAFPGEVVVGLVDGENTLKRLMKNESGVMYLKAENAKYPDIHALHELEIQGVVRYLIRKF